jgi:hypothetical protein
MCTDNPDMPKEANKAKCFVIACFVFSIFSMIGFAGGIPGVVGALCGILACIASSILMCCAPKSTEDGGGKFTAAGVLLLLAGVVQLVMGTIVIVHMIMVLNEVNDSSYCKDRYSTCDVDTAGNNCKDALVYKDSVCVKDNPSDADTSCGTQSAWDICKSGHETGKAVVTGIVVVLFGVSAFFLYIAGLLNTLGGAYCLKAKSAIQAKGISPATGTAVPVQGQIVSP